MLQSCTGHLFTARFTDSAIQREIIPFFPIALPPSPSVFSALLFPIQLFLFIFSPCSLPLGISAQKKKNPYSRDDPASPQRERCTVYGTFLGAILFFMALAGLMDPNKQLSDPQKHILKMLFYDMLKITFSLSKLEVFFF